ncbi:protein AKNAD1 isoform X5 [Tympanuchus pallidicinctus]|uniref:protein AKNAD1 isoform X5 n=1 Tax=Tympanuchus pallidicinctus TaxID=109042 RepID=UPI002287014D|nr:protein AKNAD1 isoform X5 [Tympanuchus pallidicinctus]
METQMSCSIPNELHCVTDTTDAEQDDLPCDGDGGIACEHHGKSDQLNDCTYIPDALNLSSERGNRNASSYEIYVQPEGVFNYAEGTIGTSGISAGIPGSELSFKKDSWCGQPDGRDPPSHSSMSHVLLRHFPTGELTSKWQLIEHETIPETSLTESIDETTNKHTACECVQGPSTGEQQAAKFEEHHLEKLKAVLPQSGFPNAGFAIYSGDIGTAPEASTADTSVLQPSHGLSEPRLPCGKTVSAFPTTHTVELCSLNASNSLPKITQGEMMSQMLKEQTDQLKIKVEDFSKHVTKETFLLQDDYLALNQLKRYLEALERNYLTAREEHRNLQLQYYKDKSVNIGEFDPKRKVEGEIFRLGTMLEDIKELADDSRHRWAPSPSSCGSAHSSYSLWESSVLSSIADSPEENTFLSKNNEGENTSQTSSVTPQRNAHFSLQCDRCNLRIHTLQKRAESTYGKEMDPLGKSCLLASKYSSHEMRFFSPEGKYEAEGLGFHTQGTLSQKDSASEESMKGNNIMERKTGTHTIFILRKPTDLSDKNLNNDSEAISAYHSYGSQSDEFMKCESHQILHARLHRERKGFKCRCSRESQNPFKLRNYKESVQSCTLRRNKNSGSTSYLQKRIPSQKAQINQQPPEPVNRLYQSKKSARNTSAIIRNRTAKDFNINILNSTLDHAIQTANSLKKATEKMVQAISEDLAKARRKQL